MAPASAVGRAVASFLAVSWCVAPLLAQASAPPHPLADLLDGLRLTGGGVQEWLGRLGVTAGQPAHERLLAVNSTGEIVGALDGVESQVVVTPEFDRDYIREGAGLVLVHNHPASTSLSQQDLAHLDSPGVSAVVAIGHDGSVYAAAKPLASGRARHCDPECYAKARDEVGKVLRLELGHITQDGAAAGSFATHLTLLALAKAGYYDYLSLMASDRRLIFDRHAAAFGRVVASARAVVDK